MDGHRFDAFAKSMSRRGALKTIFGGLLATFGVDESGEAKKEKHPFHRAGKRCNSDDKCGPFAPCTDGYCVPTACLIDGTMRELGELNPNNPCQFCSPSASPGSWELWMGVVPDGDACQVEDGNPCRSEAGICINVECVRDPSPNDSSCGPNQTCCNGECCPEGTICSDRGCVARECTIEGTSYPDDTINPAHDCQICDPDRSDDSWSSAADGTTCGEVAGRVCCNGECCSPTECCNPAGFCEECGPHCRIGGVDFDAETVNPANPCQVCKPDLNPLDWSIAEDGTDCGDDQCCHGGSCRSCGCMIEGRPFESGAGNPDNKCQVCDPNLNPAAWSPRAPNFPCGLTGGRFCCGEICCPQGECCNETGECEPCGCLIGTENVVAGAVNPANTCKVCDPTKNSTGWTVLKDDEACGGDGDDRVCCSGTCCEQGNCCVDGACEACGCEIEGVPIDAGTINPENSCQKCEPSHARLSWSPVTNGEACGVDGDQKCCGGECCSKDQCCILDACGPCICSIEGVNYEKGAHPDDNPCLVCDPERDPFGWSPASGDACGENGDQVCCNGTCCESGQCCSTDEQCIVCGCTIEGQDVPDQTVNPDNACQICDRSRNPIGWSPVDDNTACGVNGDQVCCAGNCCADGQCCDIRDGVCETCQPLCMIDGLIFQPGFVNPNNTCQICDPSSNETGWTTLGDGEPCGLGGDQQCCDGVCRSEDCGGFENPCDGADPCGCTVDGAFHAHGEIFEGNSCFVCDVSQSLTSWTIKQNGASCTPEGGGNSQCCNGLCCGDGQSCDTDGFCGDPPPGPNTCTIGGQVYNNHDLNPANKCLMCASDVNPNDWTPKRDNFYYDPPDDMRTCCAGAPCDLGVCCNFDETCSIPNCF